MQYKVPYFLKIFFGWITWIAIHISRQHKEQFIFEISKKTILTRNVLVWKSIIDPKSELTHKINRHSNISRWDVPNFNLCGIIGVKTGRGINFFVLDENFDGMFVHKRSRKFTSKCVHLVVYCQFIGDLFAIGIWNQSMSKIKVIN